MRLNVRRFVSAVMDKYNAPGNDQTHALVSVAEFGSRQVDPTVEINIRDLVREPLQKSGYRVEYIGYDYDAGPGVGVTHDLHRIITKDDKMFGAYDLIFCLETFEHVRNPYLAMANLAKMLKPDGLLVLSVPYFFQWHARPHYWGITPDGLGALLEDAKLNSAIDMDPPARNPGDSWEFPHTVVAVASPGDLAKIIDLEGLKDSKWQAEYNGDPVRSVMHFISKEQETWFFRWVDSHRDATGALRLPKVEEA